MKKWLRRFIKIGFFLFAFMAVILTVLVNMTGNSDNLKAALEDYLFSISGMPAQIETLNQMTFYPYVSVDVEGIKLSARGKDLDAITVRKAVIAIGFWDVVLKRRAFKNLHIEDAEFIRDTVFKKPLSIKKLAIDEDPSGRSYLGVRGLLDGEPLRFDLDMETYGRAKSPKYKIDDESDFAAALGEVELQGTLRPRALGGFHIRDFTLAHRNTDIMTGDLSFVRDSNKIMDIKGELAIEEHGTKTGFDVEWDSSARTMTGSMEAQIVIAEDFQPETRLHNALKAWHSMVGSEAKTAVNIDVTADIFAKSNTQTKNYRGILHREESGRLVFQEGPAP